MPPVHPPQYSQNTASPQRTAAKPQDYRSRLMASLETLPPLPVVLNQLLQKLNDDRHSTATIASLIEKDTVLSGSVLRCINSAYYGLQKRVTSIRHAVTLLGFSTVRNLALAFSMRRLLSRPRTPSAKLYSRYSGHALGCAVMTQFLAVFTRTEDVESAFAGGLFHDVGKLVIFTTLPEVTPQIVRRWEESSESFETCEREILGIGHPELSAALLHRWKLPEPIRLAARHHHDPEALAGGDCEEALVLARLIHAADLYVNANGLQTYESSLRAPEDPEPAFQKIGLGDKLPELEERFHDEFVSIRQSFEDSGT